MDISDQHAMIEMLAVNQYENPGDICTHLQRPLQLAHRPAFRESQLYARTSGFRLCVHGWISRGCKSR